MVDLRPFRALRYRARDLTRLSAPPYDVIDPDERRALCAADPHNVVRLLLPEGDGDRYGAAAALLRRWCAEGILVRDLRPRLYGYRMERLGPDGAVRTTTGLLGALTLPARLGTDGLAPHERTLPKARSDRLALLRATRTNLDPIWCLAGEPADACLTEALEVEPEPLAESSDPEGVRHTMWAVDDPSTVAAVSAAVRAAPLLVADGHHRLETAIAWRDELGGPEAAPTGAGAVLAFVTPLDDRHLCVEPIHRVLRGMPANRDWAAALAGLFEVHDAGPTDPVAARTLVAGLDGGTLGVVTRERLLRCVPRSGPLAVARAVLPPVLARIGTALFDELVRPLLGPDVTVGFRPDAGTLATLVRRGEADAAILLPPVSVAQIRAAADVGERMPEKTSYFAPKPRSGFVLRPAEP